MPALRRFLALALFSFSASLAAEPAFEDLSFPGSLALKRVAQAPSDSDRIYAISRESFLLRSDDGGRSFVAASLVPLGADTVSIEIDPLDADRVYLVTSASSTEVQISRDGGRTRSRLELPAGASGFWLDPEVPERYYSARSTRLLLHENGSWSELAEIAPGQADGRLADLAIDSSRPGHLLAGLDLGFGEALTGIHESFDGGATWTLRQSGQPPEQLAFDPFDPQVAWAILDAGDDALWRSADGGRTWIDQDLAQGGISLSFELDPARPGHLVVAGLPRHGSEVSYLLSRDQGGARERIVLPYGDSQDYDLSLLPDGRWIVTTLDPAAATWSESSDLGATWTSRQNLPGRLVALALDPGEPEHAWAATERGVFRTTRGGASWVPVFAPDVPLADARLAVDPQDPRILLLAHSRFTAGPFLWRSADRGRTWQEALRSTGAIYLAGLVAGRRGGAPFALAGFATETFERVVWRSTDLGASWQLRSGESIAGAAVGDDGAIFRLAGPRVEGSLDGGLGFATIADFSAGRLLPVGLAAGPGEAVFVLASEEPLSVPAALFEMRPGQPPVERFLPVVDCFSSGGLLAAGGRPGQLFYTANCGLGPNRLFASADAGRSWQLAPRGLPEGPLADVAASRADGSLWVVPETFGVFRGPADSEAAGLRLQQGRFAITASFRDGAGRKVAGRPRFLTEETGYFALETPERIEVAVKILDGRPLTGSFWLFYASLTRQELELEVRDLELGEVRRYHHPGGTLASFADLGGLESPPPFAPRLAPAAEPVPVNLAGGRFLATVEWHDFTGNTYGNGQELRLADDSTAAFHFFWPANLELFVRLTDHRNENGHFGVAVASLTNVEYVLTVRDTLTGQEWVYHNPLGTFASVEDALAFPAAASAK